MVKKTSLFRRHPKGKAILASHKQCIGKICSCTMSCFFKKPFFAYFSANVFQGLLDQGQARCSARDTTSRLTGVSLCNVKSIIQEIEQFGCLSDNSSGTRQKKDVIDKMDTCARDMLDNLVHKLFRQAASEARKPIVSLRSIHQEVVKDQSLPTMSRSSLRKVLLAIGYQFLSNETDRNVLLIEKSEIIWWRKR